MTEVGDQGRPKTEAKNSIQQIVASEAIKQSEDNQTVSKGPTLKHKHRKKRVKKIKQRDPQEVKEIKLQRINMKREEHWDNRFVNDTIPDMLLSRPKKRRTQIFRKPQSPLHSSFQLEKDSKKDKLPNLTVKNVKSNPIKHTSKSFKIRTVEKKEEETEKGEQQNEKKFEMKDRVASESNNNNGQSKVETIAKTNKGEKQQKKLLSQLTQRTLIHPVNQTYKSMLLNLIQLCSDKKKYKQVRNVLDQQIKTIGGNQNAYAFIFGMIQERRKLIAEIRQLKQSVTLKTCFIMQMCSLTLVQEILKFKAKWEEIYFKYFQTEKKINYDFEGSNYLLKMKEEVKQLAFDGVADPFLVCKTAELQDLMPALKQDEEKEAKQIKLKIRACELLLIEEQLSVSL